MNQPTTQFIIATVVLSLMASGCAMSRPNATAGGLFGGAAGGIMGAAIGSHSGKTEEGAILGAVAGGLTGAVMGNQTDQATAQRRAFENNQIAMAQQSAVTIDQVVRMTASGLSDELIINQLATNGMAQRLTTNDLIQLKSQGVSDSVIRQMQTAGPPQFIATNQQPPMLYAPRPQYVDPTCAPVGHVFATPNGFSRGPRARRNRSTGIHFEF